MATAAAGAHGRATCSAQLQQGSLPVLNLKPFAPLKAWVCRITSVGLVLQQLEHCFPINTGKQMMAISCSCKAMVLSSFQRKRVFEISCFAWATGIQVRIAGKLLRGTLISIESNTPPKRKEKQTIYKMLPTQIHPQLRASQRSARAKVSAMKGTRLTPVWQLMMNDALGPLNFFCRCLSGVLHRQSSSRRFERQVRRASMADKNHLHRSRRSELPAGIEATDDLRLSFEHNSPAHGDLPMPWVPMGRIENPE